MSKDVVRRSVDAPPLLDVEELPTVQLEALRQESETALQARGAAYVREYAAIEHKSTILAKSLAMVCVAVRIQHDDMLGTTHEYRQSVAELYRQSGVQGDTLERLKGTVRWHIGNVLRQHLTTRQVRALGLRTSSPLERGQDARKSSAAIVRAAKVSASAGASRKGVVTKNAGAGSDPTAGETVKATADHLRLSSAANNLIGQLSVDVIDHDMTDGQRAKLDAELATLQKSLTRLRRHTRKRTSDG
ncbi:hypothetical protein [Streptomyces sp. NPDC091212]|uniref:hypothetical protein n=1 Tax=Streptomyces sp. NPDC091212 TaxID=3155191 RepID=UPI003428620B